VGAASGAPKEFLRRKVKIYKPSLTAMQNGAAPAFWQLEFEVGQNWLNPLMGWTSSRDMTSELIGRLRFPNPETAIEYCKQQGFDFEVAKDHKPKKGIKSYAANFATRKYGGIPQPYGSQIPETKP